MAYIQLSKSEYYDLTAKMCEIELPSGMRPPSEKDIQKMFSVDPRYFLSLAIWIQSVQPTEHKDIWQMRQELVSSLLDKFVWISEEPTASYERIPVTIPYLDYQKVRIIAKQLSFLGKGWMPFSLEQMPDPRFSFGFDLSVLIKNSGAEGTEPLSEFRDYVEKTFACGEDPRDMVVNYDDYEQLINSVESLPYKRDRWWPTPDEIETIIKPNFSMCYEFVVWILETGPEPKNKTEREAVLLLNQMLKDTIKFCDNSKA